MELKNELQKKLSYREVTFDDCDLLFAWANDSLTRLNSENEEPIKYDNHVSWLRNKLDSVNDWMFIVMDNIVPVALLRLNKKESDIFLSYLVASEHRGKGIGSEAISLLPEIIRNGKIQCNKLIAKVYKTNIASIKIFIKAGFEEKDNGDFYTFTRNVSSGS